ncbi:MAG TPA: aminopeptidase, partial [Solirubrobacteraceae bacterium]|nr:aminopeptidase [Solirubrobacteraceae bacterium]
MQGDKPVDDRPDGPHESDNGSGHNGRVQRLADLIVGFAANVQPGQIVAISTEPGKLELTRAVADSAYRAGAKFVDVQL